MTTRKRSTRIDYDKLEEIRNRRAKREISPAPKKKKAKYTISVGNVKQKGRENTVTSTTKKTYDLRDAKQWLKYFINVNKDGKALYRSQLRHRMNARNIDTFPDVKQDVEEIKRNSPWLLRYMITTRECKTSDDDPLQTAEDPSSDESEHVQECGLQHRLSKSSSESLADLSGSTVTTKVPVMWCTKRSWKKKGMVISTGSSSIVVYMTEYQDRIMYDDDDVQLPLTHITKIAHLYPSYVVVPFVTSPLYKSINGTSAYSKYVDDIRRGVYNLREHLIFSYGGLFTVPSSNVFVKGGVSFLSIMCDISTLCDNRRWQDYEKLCSGFNSPVEIDFGK